MKTTRILIVEDSPEYQEVIAFGLNEEPDLEIAGRFITADSALRKLKQLSAEELPDLILLDLNLPGISGQQAIPQFLNYAPQAKIIVLTESNKEEDVIASLSSGAIGYLLKESSLEKIIEGIHIAMNGGASIDPLMAQYLLKQHRLNTPQTTKQSLLSPRELEVIILVAEGIPQKQIADKLEISQKTVDYHISRLYKKLNVHNAPGAVAKAYERGILSGKKTD